MVDNEVRDYLVEAIQIISGRSLLLASRKHLQVLWLATPQEKDEALLKAAAPEDV